MKYLPFLAGSSWVGLKDSMDVKCDGKGENVIPSFSSLVLVLYYSRQAKYVWNIRLRCVCDWSPPPPQKKNGYLPPPPPYWLPGIFVYLWVPKIAYISGAWFDLTGCKRFSAGNASDKWQVCMRIEANDLLLRVYLVFLPKACNLFSTIPLDLLSFFLPCTGAKEAFLNKTLLYRDEMVKKVVYLLASPCYSVVLTSPQTALTVAHARKEIVKLTLAAEGKVIAMKTFQFLLS